HKLVVDPVLTVSGATGFARTLLEDRVTWTTPEDFDGSFVFTYRAVDPIGAVSADAAIVVVNVAGVRDAPKARPDTIMVGSAAVHDFALATLLANDFDLEGDPIRITGFTQPAAGTLDVIEGVVTLEAPAALAAGSGDYVLTLADGSPAPAWAAIDPATGTLTLTVPFALRANLAFAVTRGEATETVTTTVDGNALAILRYTRDPGDIFTDAFTYQVTDDRDGTSTGQVTLLVNRAPVARNDRFDAVEDTVFETTIADLLANDSDADGDALTIVSITPATFGTVERIGDTIRFTPPPDWDGAAHFDYTVEDGRGGTSTARVRIDVASTNRAPVAGTDVLAGTEDTPLFIDVAALLANDFDPDGDPITFLGLVAPGAGADYRVFTLPDGNWQVMPEVNANGLMVIGYRITDGRITTTGTIEATFAPVNDGPVLRDDDRGETPAGTTLAVVLADLLANDYDPEGDAFAVTEVFGAVNGSVTMAGGIATFTPREGYAGPASFRYTVTDALGAQSLGRYDILVTPADLPPVAVSDHGFETDEDTFIVLSAVDLMANDLNPALGDLVFLGFRSPGVTDLGGGLYRYTPPADFYGPVVLRYAITNVTGIEVQGQVHVAVLPVPDAPVARPDALATVAGQALLVEPAALLANDSDADGHAFVLTAVQGGTGIAVRLTEGGLVEVTPLPGFSGAGSFTYTLTDTSGLTATGFVSVAVEALNRAPEQSGPMLPLEATGGVPFALMLSTGVFSDPDGDELTYALTLADGSPLPVWMSFSALTQRITGTPPVEFSGSLSLRITVSDGQASVTDLVTLNVAPASAFATVIEGAGTLNGTSAADLIRASAGDDSLSGLAGNDLLVPGLGNDTVAAGAGNDTIVYAGGDDVILGDAS
ncbi:MAG TPA: Ig-like domain-containing protein, partial [Paracoccaceae bacterium]|nr:Ig-like domain-containing protein [Paracoccaceae bacterium]